MTIGFLIREGVGLMKYLLFMGAMVLLLSACTAANDDPVDGDKDIQPEIDVEIDPEDLRIDFYRSSGPGGQHVNKTSSAVRLTHLPTGLVVTCQDEKSQHKNKAKAMKVLRSRLLDIETSEQQSKISEERRTMVGSGDRSERIRTYNFPQARVTDHRIGLSLYKLEALLQGDLDLVIEPLLTYFQTEAIKKADGN